MKARPSLAEVETRRKAAYARGWADSLRGYQAISEQPWLDRFDYGQGWWDCVDWRQRRDPRMCTGATLVAEQRPFEGEGKGKG